MSTWSSRSAVTQRKTSSRRRRPRLTKVSGVWGAITAVIGLLALMVQSVELIVTAVVCLLITIVAAFAGQSVAVPTRTVERRSTKSPGNTSRRRPATQKPGTASKRRKCSVACRKSSQPASTCDCSCRGSSHGSDSGVTRKSPTPTRAELKSRLAKKQERSVVRSQRGQK